MTAFRPIIEVNAISKCYKLGHFNMTSFREEVSRIFGMRRGASPSTRSSNEEFWALRDVSFAINAGEVVGIIGRNGAGKSTLLKILSRITEPTSGEAVLRGRVASLLEVGTGFHPELSGRENIFLNGAILGMKRAEIAAKFDEIVDFAEISQFIDTPVKRYSSGMYVRLAFAVAAHLEPDILIVDEVLAVGDIAFQRKCVGRMNEVSRDGRTVLFVSHNLGLVDTLCQSAICLKQGEIIAQGATDEVIAVYNNLTESNLSTARRGDKPIAQVTVESLPAQESLIKPEGGFRLNILLNLQKYQQPNLVVRLRNIAGVVVQHFNSCLDDFDQNRDAISGMLLEVPKCSLPPGPYSLDLELWVRGQCIDSITSACQLDIADGFYDGRPAKACADNATSLIPYRWSVK